jgi:hypothetical protein
MTGKLALDLSVFENQGSDMDEKLHSGRQNNMELIKSSSASNFGEKVVVGGR